MPIDIDETRRPIIHVTFVGDPSDAEVDRFLVAMRAHILARKQKTVTIYDLTRIGGTTAAQRRRQAEWVAENAESLRATSLGVVFVIRSAVARGVLTSILWTQPLPQPHAIVTTLAEADLWAREKLRAAGAPLPP